MKRRPISGSVALAIVAIALLSSRRTSLAATIVGPGIVPAPLEIYGGGDYRFLPGTEIVSNEVTTFPDGTKRGGRAIYIVDSEHYVFEGGRYEGASVAATSPTPAAFGGSAVEFYTSTNPTVVVYDGLIRGGSVTIDSSISLNDARGGEGLDLTSRYNSRVVMFGGVVAGGVVAHAAAPDTALKTAYAIATGGYTDSSRHQIDIYGGTLTGGVLLNGHSRFTVHGSDLAISPDPTGTFTQTTQFTLSGTYANGNTFSHSVVADPFRWGFISHAPGSLTIELYTVPEPSSLALAAAAGLALRRRRAQPLGLAMPT